MRADAIIHDAAVRIGLATTHLVVTSVCLRMKDELVQEEWQLAFIDSFQWKELGAPVGLVAAIRYIITHPQQEQQQQPRTQSYSAGEEYNVSSNNNKRTTDGIGGLNAERAKKSKPTQSGNEIAFRSFPGNFFYQLAAKLVDKGVDGNRLMAWVDSLVPEIPPTILVEHILPMLDDRRSFNRLRSVSKETYDTSQKLIANGKITPPWPSLKSTRTATVCVSSVAFSPDGGYLAFGGESKVVYIWNGRDGRYTQLEGHAGLITCLAFSTDGTILASGSEDRTIRLWTLVDRSCKVLEGHGNWVTSIAFSKDGLSVAGGCHNGSSRIWNISSGICTRILSSIQIEKVWSIAFSPDGGTLATAGGQSGGDLEEEFGTILFWDILNGDDSSTSSILLESHGMEVNSIAYSPDGRYLASGSDDHTITLWNVADRRCLAVYEGYGSVVWSVCFSPNGKVLASGSRDGRVRFWNVEVPGGGCLVNLPGNDDAAVHSVAFSPDGRTLASGSSNGTLRLWNPNEHKRDKRQGDWDELMRLWNVS
jgi:hypothetical protein